MLTKPNLTENDYFSSFTIHFSDLTYTLSEESSEYGSFIMKNLVEVMTIAQKKFSVNTDVSLHFPLLGLEFPLHMQFSKELTLRDIFALHRGKGNCVCDLVAQKSNFLNDYSKILNEADAVSFPPKDDVSEKQEQINLQISGNIMLDNDNENDNDIEDIDLGEEILLTDEHIDDTHEQTDDTHEQIDGIHEQNDDTHVQINDTHKQIDEQKVNEQVSALLNDTGKNENENLKDNGQELVENMELQNKNDFDDDLEEIINNQTEEIFNNSMNLPEDEITSRLELDNEILGDDKLEMDSSLPEEATTNSDVPTTANVEQQNNDNDKKEEIKQVDEKINIQSGDVNKEEIKTEETPAKNELVTNVTKDNVMITEQKTSLLDDLGLEEDDDTILDNVKLIDKNDEFIEIVNHEISNKENIPVITEINPIESVQPTNVLEYTNQAEPNSQINPEYQNVQSNQKEIVSGSIEGKNTLKRKLEDTDWIHDTMEEGSPHKKQKLSDNDNAQDSLENNAAQDVHNPIDNHMELISDEESEDIDIGSFEDIALSS